MVFPPFCDNFISALLYSGKEEARGAARKFHGPSFLKNKDEFYHLGDPELNIRSKGRLLDLSIRLKS